MLSRALESFGSQARELNACLITDLTQLEAVEAAPLMEKAFAADRVDISLMGDWEDVQIELGLLDERLTPAPPVYPVARGIGLGMGPSGPAHASASME